MTSVGKLIPWLLSALFGLALVLVWHSSELKLAQKDAEISALRDQYNNLVADTNAKLAESRSRLGRLAAEAQHKIQLANQPEVSVSVSFRKALLSSGYVAVINNTSGQTISVDLDLARGTSDQRKRFELVIDGGRRKEIGEMEGWAFVSGDTLQFSQANHKAVTFNVP